MTFLHRASRLQYNTFNLGFEEGNFLPTVGFRHQGDYMLRVCWTTWPSLMDFCISYVCMASAQDWRISCGRGLAENPAAVAEFVSQVVFVFAYV